MSRLLVPMIGLLLAGETAAMADASVPKARDPDIAVQQEYAAARAKCTLEAFDLFIARHPDHRLAEQARRDRAALAGRLRRR